MKKLLFTTLSVFFLFSCSNDENGNNSTSPVLTTANITNITPIGASSGGNITSDGGTSITARGVVWSTSQNPTIALTTKTIDGVGFGTFASTISGLTPNTTYYARAYATNSAGTSYGNEITFTTIVDVTTGLIAFYPFNGNANDASGNGNNGVINGTVSLTTDRNGNQNSAYNWANNNSSSNSTSFIRLPNLSNQFSNGEISIALWVMKYPNPIGIDPRILGIGENGLIFDLNSSSLKVFMGLGLNTNTNPLGDNEWVHIVYTSNGTTGDSRFYINGSLIHQKNTNPDLTIISNTNVAWELGRKSTASFNGFGGKMDDIRIYNRTLNQSEVTNLFNN